MFDLALIESLVPEDDRRDLFGGALPWLLGRRPGRSTRPRGSREPVWRATPQPPRGRSRDAQLQSCGWPKGYAPDPPFWAAVQGGSANQITTPIRVLRCVGWLSVALRWACQRAGHAWGRVIAPDGQSAGGCHGAAGSPRPVPRT